MSFFAGFLKIITWGVGILHNFSAPGVEVSDFLYARGVGNLPFQKNSLGILPGGQAWN